MTLATALPNRLRFAIAAFALTLATGCGGGDGGTGPGGSPTRSMALAAGDNQTARINSAVPVAPAVVVRDGSNQPVAGVSVTFAVENGGGTITGASAITNANGVATARAVHGMHEGRE